MKTKTLTKIISLLACLTMLSGFGITASAETAAEFEQAKAQAAAAGTALPETDENGLPVFIDTGFRLGQRTFDVKKVSGTTPGGVYVYGDWSKDYYNWQVALLDAAVDASGVTNEMSQYEKCVKYARYVADVLEYNGTDDHAASQFEWKAVQDGLKALYSGQGICGHYADLFRLLCERTGINCDTVSGQSTGGRIPGLRVAHAWNEVLADGKTYYVDATWLDSTGNEKYLMSETEWPDHMRDYRKQEVYFEQEASWESAHAEIMSYGQQDTPVPRDVMAASAWGPLPDNWDDDPNVQKSEAIADAMEASIAEGLARAVADGTVIQCGRCK